MRRAQIGSCHLNPVATVCLVTQKSWKEMGDEPRRQPNCFCVDSAKTMSSMRVFRLCVSSSSVFFLLLIFLPSSACLLSWRAPGLCVPHRTSYTDHMHRRTGPLRHKLCAGFYRYLSPVGTNARVHARKCVRWIFEHISGYPLEHCIYHALSQKSALYVTWQLLEKISECMSNVCHMKLARQNARIYCIFL